MIALLMGGSLVLLLGLLGGVSLVARRTRMHPELARKAIHVGLGLYCLTLPLLFHTAAPVLIVCAAAILLLLAIRLRAHRTGGLGAGLHSVARQSYGEIFFAAAIGLLFLLGHNQPVTYVLPVAILTLSDAAAALVGVAYGRRLFRIEDGTKSAEGAAIFLLTAWIIAMVLLLLLSDAPRLNVIVLGGLVALYGTLVEASSWRGWGNFFLPMAVHTLLMHHLSSPPPMLLEGALIGSTGLAFMLALAPRLGLDRHAAVFVATVLGTIGMASSAWNVVVPGLALACHLYVEWPEFGPRANPHLKLGLVMVMLSLCWYLVGNLTPFPTVFAFNTSFAALGLCIVAAHGRLFAALALVPLFSAAVLARGAFPDGATPTDTGSIVQLATLLAGAVLVTALLRRRHPLACEGLGVLSFAAGALAFPRAF